MVIAGDYHVQAASIEKEQLILDLLGSGVKISAASQAVIASERYSDCSQRVPRQITGVHLAAYFRLSETTMSLLGNTHDPDTKDINGHTPLAWTARNRHEAVVKLLLDKEGVDPDSKDTIYGQTPLSLAAESGHEAVVKLLLDKGVNPDSKETDGRTPLSWAAEKGHEAVVKLLQLSDALSL